MLDPSPDVIVLTETNLYADIKNGELGLNNYIIFRNDRNNILNPSQGGGGVLIAVRKKSCLKSSKINIKNCNCEQLYVKIVVKNCKYNVNNKLIVSAVHLPPRSVEDKYINYISTLE